MTSERLLNSFIPPKTFIPAKQISGYAPCYMYLAVLISKTVFQYCEDSGEGTAERQDNSHGSPQICSVTDWSFESSEIRQ